MSQASRQNQRNNPWHKINNARLRELVFIAFCFAALYLFVSLATYDPLDPGFSHNPNAPAADQIRNQGGLAGALFADLFFKWFGYFAYLFAYMVGYLGWLIYQGRHHALLSEPKHLILPGIGFFLTLMAGCGLAIVHFAAESALLPSHAGGDLGSWIGNGLQNNISALGATLLLLVLFFTGITMLTGMSWLKLMDRLGEKTLHYIPIFFSYLRHQIWPIVLRKSRTSWRWVRLKAEQLQHFYITQQHKKRHRQAARQAAVELPDQIQKVLQDSPAPPAPAPVSPPPHEQGDPPVETITDNMDAVEMDTHAAQEPAEPVSRSLPSLQHLTPSKAPNAEQLQQATQALQQKIEALFVILDVEQAHIIAVHSGPLLSRVEIYPGKEQISHVVRLADQLIEQLDIQGSRATETNTELLTLEIPHSQPEHIALRELLNITAYQDSRSPLTLALGKDTNGYSIIVDLARMPHLLLGGSHATDINTALHTFLLSIVYKAQPAQVRLILMDSKQKCFAPYRDLQHLLSPIITQPEALLESFEWCVNEMERRYRIMAEQGVRNIDGYNRYIDTLQQQTMPEDDIDIPSPLPYIVVVLHEIAELNHCEQERDIESFITRLAQKARASGIHMLLGSSHPTVNVMTGLMKTNFPTRMAFQVNNKAESRHILGQSGAEYLLGQGDMLYLTPGTGIPARIHGAHVDGQEVQAVMNALKPQGKPKYWDLSD